MRGIKLLLAALFSLSMLCASAQYVQPMSYTNYSFLQYMNIGNGSPKTTDISAYLELGKATGSIRGFLLPRGKKDTIISPAKGLLFYDLTGNKPVFYNGSSWQDLSTPSLLYGLMTSGGGIMVDTATLKSVFQGTLFNAGSGIGKTTSTYNIGDTLTQDATFFGRLYSFNVGLPAQRVNSFTVFSRNGVQIQDTISGGYAPSLSMNSGSVTVQGKTGVYYGNSWVELRSAFMGTVVAPKIYITATDSIIASGIPTSSDVSLKELAITGTGKIVQRTPVGTGGGSSIPYYVGNVVKTNYNKGIWFPPYDTSLILHKAELAWGDMSVVIDTTQNTDSSNYWRARLVNDQLSPGNSKYYGTDGSGVKGWHTLAGGGGSSTLSQYHLGIGDASNVLGEDDHLLFQSDSLKVRHTLKLFKASSSIFLTTTNNDLLINATGEAATFRMLPFGNDIYFDNIIAGDIIFRPNSTEKLRVTSSGITTPAVKLQGATYTTTIQPNPFLVFNSTLTAPMASGTIAISVNLVTPSANGNITLSTADIPEGTNQYFTSARVIASLPSQSGNSGKYLTTNGTTLSWATVSGGGSGITSLGGLTGATQTFATGTSGTDFGISSSGTTHTFNIPDASATARGLITTGSQTFAGNKKFNDEVLINTTDAGSYALQVSGDSKTAAIKVTNDNSAYEFYFSGNAAANFYCDGTTAPIYFNTAGGPIYYGNSDGGTTLMVKASNVGIGYTSATTPSYLLDVNGTVGIAGLLTESYELQSDANFTLSKQVTALPTITANRTATLPSSPDGTVLTIKNTNNNGNAWAFNTSVYKPDGTTFTTIDNLTVYVLVRIASNWHLVSKQQ